VNHQPTPFQIKKEIRRGEISEKGKGGGWRGASAFSADRRGGSALQIFSEIGSDFGVKSHQITLTYLKTAKSGLFLLTALS